MNVARVSRGVVLLLSLCWVPNVSAQQAPAFDIRGDTVGTPKEKTRGRCFDSSVARDVRSCMEIDQRFGAAEGYITRYYRAGMLVGVMVGFNAKDYELFRDGWVEKYGRPSCESRTVGNAMGAKFPNEICRWQLATCELRVAQRSGKIDTGNAACMVPEILDEAGRNRKATDL